VVEPYKQSRQEIHLKKCIINIQLK